MEDDFADTTGELEVTIAGLVGTRLDALQVAVTVGPRGGDADEIQSLVAALSHVEPIGWEIEASYPEWLVDLARADDGTVVAVAADGSLRVGTGAGALRYPLPARRGLASVWPVSGRELLVCGPGSLGHVRLGPGRIAVDLLDDDGPGEAGVVRGFGGQASGAIAVGTRGALWCKDDEGWTAHETPARESLLDIAWTDPARAFVCGAEGGLYTWDGGALRELRRDRERSWRSCAWWRGALYLISAGEGVWRLDGDDLIAIKPLPLDRVRVVADHLFAWGGTLLARHDGTAWWGGPLNLP